MTAEYVKSEYGRATAQVTHWRMVSEQVRRRGEHYKGELRDADKNLSFWQGKRVDLYAAAKTLGLAK